MNGEKLAKLVPEGWGKNERGGMQVFETEKGRALAIFFNIDLDSVFSITDTSIWNQEIEEPELTFRSFLKKSGYPLPANIKTIQLFSFTPEEMLPQEYRLTPASESEGGLISDVAATTTEANHTSSYLTRQPMEALIGHLNQIFGGKRLEEKAAFCESLGKKQTKDTWLIVSAHGGGVPLTMSEQSSHLTLRHRKTGKLVKAEEYPESMVWSDYKVDNLATSMAPGNEILAQSLVDAYDRPESNVAGIAFIVCNFEKADLRANNLSLAYVRGLASQLHSMKDRNQLVIKS